MKKTIFTSQISSWLIILGIGLFTLLSSVSLQAQGPCQYWKVGDANDYIYINSMDTRQGCLTQALTWAVSEWPGGKYYVIINVLTSEVFYYSNTAGKKVKNKPTALSANEVSNKPGMSKYKPFRGNDDVQISVGAHTLIFHGNEGTANENPLNVCQSELSQQCKNPNTWVVTKDEKASNDAYQIQPSNDKKAYLCFNGPDGGISVHRNPAKTDECIKWTIVPSQIGKDGEVKGYNIYPTKHPEYVLAVDTRSNQVRVDKVNTKGEAAGEPNKAVLTNWTFTPGKSKRKVTNQEKVLQNAEQK